MGREKLTAYLSDLTLYRITTDHVDYGSGGETQLLVHYTVSGDAVWVTVFDRSVTVHGDLTNEARTYYLAEDVDWEYLLSVLPEGA